MAVNRTAIESTRWRELELIHLLEELAPIGRIADVGLDLDLGDLSLSIDPEVHLELTAPYGTGAVSGHDDELWLGWKHGSALATAASWSDTAPDSRTLTRTNPTSSTAACADTTARARTLADDRRRNDATQ